MSEVVVRGFKLSRVYPNNTSWVVLNAAYVLPANSEDRFAAVSEPFKLPSYTSVFAWTEHALRMMDRLGIAFPVSVSLYGPVMMPSAADVSEVVPMWYSTGFHWKGGFDISAAVVRIVDNLIAGAFADDAFSYEDRRFLISHYPSDLESYPDAMKRLREGMKEGSHV